LIRLYIFGNRTDIYPERADIAITNNHEGGKIMVKKFLALACASVMLIGSMTSTYAAPSPGGGGSITPVEDEDEDEDVREESSRPGSGSSSSSGSGSGSSSSGSGSGSATQTTPAPASANATSSDTKGKAQSADISDVVKNEESASLMESVAEGEESVSDFVEATESKTIEGYGAPDWAEGAEWLPGAFETLVTDENGNIPQGEVTVELTLDLREVDDPSNYMVVVYNPITNEYAYVVLEESNVVFDKETGKTTITLTLPFGGLIALAQNTSDKA
jgi:hypothetical protein